MDNINCEKEVTIIMGSESDMHVVEKAIKKLKDFGVEVDVFVASAHKSPDLLHKIIEKLEKKGTQVIIAAAGMAAHLAGFIAANTTLPVIGLPISATLKGIDALLSTVQMPKGVPVLCVGIDSGENAAIAACQILSTKNKELKNKLKQHKKEMAKVIEEKNKNLCY